MFSKGGGVGQTTGTVESDNEARIDSRHVMHDLGAMDEVDPARVNRKIIETAEGVQFIEVWLEVSLPLKVIAYRWNCRDGIRTHYHSGRVMRAYAWLEAKGIKETADLKTPLDRVTFYGWKENGEVE